MNDGNVTARDAASVMPRGNDALQHGQRRLLLLLGTFVSSGTVSNHRNESKCERPSLPWRFMSASRRSQTACRGPYSAGHPVDRNERTEIPGLCRLHRGWPALWQAVTGAGVYDFAARLRLLYASG